MHTEGLRLNWNVYASLWKQRNFLWVSSFIRVLYCLHALELVIQSSVKNDWHGTLTAVPFKEENNSSLIFFCFHRQTRKKLPSFCSCIIYMIPCANAPPGYCGFCTLFPPAPSLLRLLMCKHRLSTSLHRPLLKHD